MIHTALIGFLFVGGLKVLVFGFAVDDGEESKEKLGLVIRRRCGAGE
jgi:hypothetical protein